jgi:transcriptional regulator with XRE-family HTH domain
VATRDRVVYEGRRRARRITTLLGEELREARVVAGLRQVDVGRAVGISGAHVSRIERGLVRGLQVSMICRLLAVVGRELSARSYPAGPPLRDKAHLALLEGIRERLHPNLRMRVEVHLGLPGDQRALDARIDGAGMTIALEAETRLRDIQAQVRAAVLKQQDAGIDRLLILVKGSRGNRLALRESCGLLAATFPVSGRAALAALAAGRDPGGNAIVIL